MNQKDVLAARAGRRRAVAAIVFAHLLAAAGQALAQDPAAQPAPAAARVAVLSLIGDKLLIVGSQMSTGSHMDRNRREFIDMPSDDFDITTARDFELRLKRDRRDAPVVAIRSRDPVLRTMQDEVLAGNRELKDLAARLRPALEAQGITHLALITRQRGDAHIRIASGSIGLGRLEGLGFYVDRWTPMVNRETGDSGKGFLAPFAYFAVTLVDLGTLTILAQDRAGEAAAFGTTDATQAIHAWDALGAERKTAALRQFVRQGLDKVAPVIADKLPK